MFYILCILYISMYIQFSGFLMLDICLLWFANFEGTDIVYLSFTSSQLTAIRECPAWGSQSTNILTTIHTTSLLAFSLHLVTSGCVPTRTLPPLAVMYKVILIIACSALSGLSPPPDHHQLSGQVKPFLAPGKTNYPARPGSCIKVGDLHRKDNADDPFSQFSDHDVTQPLGADVTQPNPSTLLNSPRPPDPHL